MLNYYLKTLGIIPWRLREFKNSPSGIFAYALGREGQVRAYLVAGPKTLAEDELLNKILSATSSTISEISVEELLRANLPVLVLGQLQIQSHCLIPLPSLEELIDSVELKRLLWQQLKKIFH